MYRNIHRSQKYNSPMLGAGLIALILLITGIALLSMHPDANDQMRTSVMAGPVLNSAAGLDRH